MLGTKLEQICLDDGLQVTGYKAFQVVWNFGFCPEQAKSLQLAKLYILASTNMPIYTHAYTHTHTHTRLIYPQLSHESKDLCSL